MEDSSQNQEEVPLPEPSTVERRGPAIRTMKSDIDELVAKTKLTYTGIVSKEVAAQSKRQVGTGAPKRRMLLLAGVGATIGAVALAAFFFLGGDGTKEEPGPSVLQTFFKTEISKTHVFKSDELEKIPETLEATLQVGGLEGTFLALLMNIEDMQGVRPATMADLLRSIAATPPQNFPSRFEGGVMLFLYHGREGSRLGIAAKTIDAGRTLRDMLLWEPELVDALGPIIFEETLARNESFQDRTYRNIDWRYIPLSSEKDFGVAYTVFPARTTLVIAFSQEAMEAAIDRLFGGTR